jgi:hypothetical protein
MANAYAAVRKKLLDESRTHEDGVHAVVNEVHLPLPSEFLLYRGFDEIGIEMRDYCIDGEPIFWRCFDHGHVTQAQQRHVKRAGNGGGAHRQHVDIVLELLQTLLMPYTEALFFVHD